MLKKLRNSKYSRLVMCMSIALCSLLVFACAEEPSAIDTTAVTTAFTKGFQSIVTNAIGLISAMLPIALTLCAVLFLVKKGMAWFRSIAK